MFSQFLLKKGLRKTPERFAVLEEVYSQSGHFDVEQLYALMAEKRYKVSRATVYNTIELLMECNLLHKHQFGDSAARYERVYHASRHDHLICSSCGEVTEFSDPRIEEIQQEVSALTTFEVTSHTLYFYGFCKKCKEQRQPNQKKEQ